MFSRAVEARERTLGMEHPRTLTSRNNLAHARPIQTLRHLHSPPASIPVRLQTGNTTGQDWDKRSQVPLRQGHHTCSRCAARPHRLMVKITLEYKGKRRIAAIRQLAKLRPKQSLAHQAHSRVSISNPPHAAGVYALRWAILRHDGCRRQVTQILSQIKFVSAFNRRMIWLSEPMLELP